MIIRTATVSDSKNLLKLFANLDTESEFMLLEPDERDFSVENQERQMSNFVDSASQTMLVAENLTQEIVGYIVGIGGKFNRNKHSLFCVIGVQLPYQGQGIGKKLLAELESWAKTKGFHRIELTVMEHNQRAINLYKSFGFEPEGLKLHSLKVSGKFVNEISMSKLLNA